MEGVVDRHVIMTPVKRITDAYVRFLDDPMIDGQPSHRVVSEEPFLLPRAGDVQWQRHKKSDSGMGAAIQNTARRRVQVAGRYSVDGLEFWYTLYKILIVPLSTLLRGLLS